MYCTACGSYSSDADAHVCAAPEATVPTTRTATTTAPALTPPSQPDAGWHADPDDPALVRYWDGSAWTEHTAWATAGAASGVGGSGIDLGSVHGRYLGALPRTVGRRGRFDVLVYERSLVFARVPGTDPAVLGFVVGLFTVSGVIGYVAGDYIGASGDAGRVAELARLSPEQVASKDKRNEVVPVSTLTEGEIVTYGRSGGRMKLRTAGTTWKRRWTRPHTKGVDGGLLLGAALGPQFPVRRGSPLRPYALPLALVVLLFALIMLAIALPTFLGARDRAQERAAFREVRPTCQAMLNLNDRAARGEQINPQELVFAVGNLVEPMRDAAGRSDDFAPALDAVARLDGFLSAWDGASAPPPTFNDDIGVVVNTCVAAARP